MIRNINIVLLILVLLAGPASLGVVVFSLVAYFGNISDQPNAFRATQGVTGLKSTCDIPSEEIRTYISNAAQYTRVSAAFIAATAKQESAFNPRAQSPYAGGVMQLANQLSYDTFDEMAARYRKDYEDNFSAFKGGTSIKPPGQTAPTAITGNRTTDIYIAEYNIFLGAKYQKELFDLYKKRAKEEKLLELVAAAYNGGAGALENARYDYTKMSDETKNYVPKVLANYRDYKARCEEDLTSTVNADALPEGTTTNDSAQQVKQRVQADGAEAWRQGPGQCAITTARLLRTVFPGRSGTEGASLGSYPNQSSTAAPTAADMRQATEELKAGRIPVWHIVGPNQEHWIAVLEVNGSNLTYFEPATGAIETSPITKAGGGGNNYFGITHEGCYQNHERGYGFTP